MKLTPGNVSRTLGRAGGAGHVVAWDIAGASVQVRAPDLPRSAAVLHAAGWGVAVYSEGLVVVERWAEGKGHDRETP
jgi:hypothetical protein